MKTRKWTDKNGLERYTTEVEANELKLLDRQENQTVAVAAKPALAVKERAATPKANYQPAFVDEEIDIPF